MPFRKNWKNELINSLSKLKKIPPRNPEIKENAKARFLAQAKLISRSPVTQSPEDRHSIWMTSLIKERKMSTLVTILLAIGLVFGGSTASVYAAQESMPDEFLYPVKVLSENVQIGFTQNREAQIELALNFALRRINEIRQLREEGLLPPEPVFARLENHINLALQQAASLGGGNAIKTLLRIREILQTQEKLMDQDGEDPILLRTRTLLQDRIQAVDSGIADPDGLYYELHMGWEMTPNSGDNNGTAEYQQYQNGLDKTPQGTENQFGDPTHENTPGAFYETAPGSGAIQQITPVPTHESTPGEHSGQGNNGLH